MQSEEGGGQKRAGKVQPQEHAPEQYGAQGMEEDIDQMVAERIVRPEPPFQPPQAECHRVVIQSACRKPGSPPAIRAFDHGIVGKQLIVVPDESGVPDRLVSQKSRRDQKQTKKQRLPMGQMKTKRICDAQ